MKLFFFTFAAILAIISLNAKADLTGDSSTDPDVAFIDPPYLNLQHPAQTWLPNLDSFLSPDVAINAPRSDLETMLHFQTPVKSQGARGTCTFFSTVGALESILIMRKGFAVDTNLSEQWLAYTVLRNQATDGSHSNTNFQALAYYGIVPEAMMPYEANSWSKAADDTLATQRCADVAGDFLPGCLVSHYDPRYLTQPDSWLRQNAPVFYGMLNTARQFRVDHLEAQMDWKTKDYHVPQVSFIKTLLAHGVPLTLDITFYNGAWNHKKAEEYGIGRNLEQWGKGVIGYPEPGSKDRVLYPQHTGAHSVVVVGYDDDAVVNTQVAMADGTTQTFQYRGVYYIKNSWGTGGFGKDFAVAGVAHPGYGMITQKYAHEMGSFYRLPIQ